MPEEYWHRSGGTCYHSAALRPLPATLAEYKAAIRRAYGSLRGVTVGIVLPGEHGAVCNPSTASERR